MMRHERVLGALVGFLLLLVPFIHPMAEANAAARPDAALICSSFGLSGNDEGPAQADDCPMGIAGCAAAAAPATNYGLVWEDIHLPQTLDLVPLRLVSADGRAIIDWSRPPGRAPPARS